MRGEAAPLFFPGAAGLCGTKESRGVICTSRTSSHLVFCVFSHLELYPTGFIITIEQMSLAAFAIPDPKKTPAQPSPYLYLSARSAACVPRPQPPRTSKMCQTAPPAPNRTSQMGQTASQRDAKPQGVVLLRRGAKKGAHHVYYHSRIAGNPGPCRLYRRLPLCCHPGHLLLERNLCIR